MLQLPSMPKKRRPEGEPRGGEDQSLPRVEFDVIEKFILSLVGFSLVLAFEYLFAAVYTAADSSFHWVAFQAMWAEYTQHMFSLELKELFLTFGLPLLTALLLYEAQ